MRLPLQLTLRNIPHSDAVENLIQEKAAKLDSLYDRIMGCRVMVEIPHRHKHKGLPCQVRIDLTLPGAELVIKRESEEDIYVAIRDAFIATRRKVEQYVRRQRGEVKTHEAPPRARISKLFPGEGYGFLETPDGREIYFHKNSVLDANFERLEIGTEVRFAEEQGDQGPQASSVMAGK